MAELSSKSYPLHECIFYNDVTNLRSLLKTENIAAKDKQGNTPLHLAVMLGRTECISLLLSHGAPVKVKNLAGWSPLAEAISYGDRNTISLLVKKIKEQVKEQMEDRRPNLVEALRQMGDFYMELKWDFQSWVPLVSRMLPSDICKIHKSGASIRMDTTFVDFNDMRWERGDISFIFNGDQKPSKSLTVLDNKAKLFQRVRYEETEDEIEDEVDILMSSDIMVVQMSTKGISFSRAQTGWIFREDKKEMVGSFHADFYQINGLVLESRKRREHLSEEDLQKNKAVLESLTKGSFQGFTNGELPSKRPSLNPPEKPRITWEEYSMAEPGQCPTLGRSLVYKESTKAFKATVAMSPDFPLSVDMLLNVLEVIATFKHFSKLREFVLMKLPPGFPVKIDIPILPTVTAKITFQEFMFKNDIHPELFQVPFDYFEDPMRIAVRLEKNRKPEKPEDFVCYESSDEEEETVPEGKQFLRTSFNFVDYIRARETNLKDVRKINQEYGSRHILTHDLFKEYSVSLNNMNKVFCSQWLSDRQVVFGTKCNKLMVYDVATQKLDQIPSLHGRQTNPGGGAIPEQQCGIHSVQINPSRTLLSTGARNSNEIAIYRLPTLDPVCVGEGGHRDWVFDMCWLDDEFLVSGSRDTKVSLWRVDSDLADAPEKVDIPTHRLIQPVCVKECRSAQKVRALAFNKAYKEIAALSLNSFIHIWSAETFKQKISRKLPACQENVCLAVQDDGVYAVGCRSYTLLLDARTLQPIKKIPSRYSGCGIRSASFQGSVLTIGTGLGMLMFYDVRAQKYLESSINSNRTVVLKASKGYVFPDEEYVDGFQNVKYTPAIYTHCYDASGTRLFTAGGPLPANLYGNYAGLWQ